MYQALKRIEKELKIINEAEEGFLEENGIIDAGPIDELDLFYWEASIKGPEDTPYESGIFNLSIKFPKNYPYKPPYILFITKIFHVNIHHDGNICRHSFKFLYDDWHPQTSIIQILTAIIDLLKYPNFNACKLYGYDQNLRHRCYDQRDYKYYNKIANEWTLKYAEGECGNFLNGDGNITEYNNEIKELITNYETKLDKVNEYYLKLIEVMEQNKQKIEKIKNELKQLNQRFDRLNDGKDYYFNKCRLKDLRDDLYKKDKEISELNLYILSPIKEKLMTITINSFDEKIHLSTTCHKNDYFSNIEKLLYEKYPEYKDKNNSFYLKGKMIDNNKNLEKNNIKDNDIILLKKNRK